MTRRAFGGGFGRESAAGAPLRRLRGPVRCAACAGAFLGCAAPLTAASIAIAAPPGAADARPRAPIVDQLVAFRDGGVVRRRVPAAAATIKVEGRRCGVASGTPLASLLRAGAGRIGLLDFGSCTRRARDGGQLFVRSIRGERNRGRSGWVYKVGRRLGSAGAADPAGPFGRGRLRGGQRVTWFYCLMRGASCQRTLELDATTLDDGGVRVDVRGYDDEGRGSAVGGASVAVGTLPPARTDASGRATVSVAGGLPAGRYAVSATKPGFVRAFDEAITVR